MILKKYDVVRTMIPFETFDDKEQGRRTLTFDKLIEAQISGNYKYNRPCVVLGADKQSGHQQRHLLRLKVTRKLHVLELA